MTAYRFTELQNLRGDTPKIKFCLAPTEPQILGGRGGVRVTEPQNLVGFEFSFLPGLEMRQPDSWESGLFDCSL
jgi:hypothetical protein